MTRKDFYLNERSLASYMEKDWSDHFADATQFSFAPFDRSNLYSDYHERLIDFLKHELHTNDAAPRRLLEVGSSLGRTFYEVCCKIKSVEHATLTEPSHNLFTAFHKIFAGEDVGRFSVLKGNTETCEATLDTKSIKAKCAAVVWKCINSPFTDIQQNPFDLVICSNVIDQCRDPLDLIAFLKKSVSPGGILLLSCTYQWQEKYIGNATKQIENINELFGSPWRHLNETNIPFQCRIYERHWLNFLSHVSIFKKTD